MTPPVSDKELISHAVTLANNSQAELARHLSMSRQNINQFVGGRPLSEQARKLVTDFISQALREKDTELDLIKRSMAL